MIYYQKLILLSIKAGHVRIPKSSSQGCYDPIRKVVTIGDACFTDFHCNDLPNTYCKKDLSIPRFNNSCQCLPNHKPFKANKRTGLLEGCSKLTEEDRYTILGCSTLFKVFYPISLLHLFTKNKYLKII